MLQGRLMVNGPKFLVAYLLYDESTVMVSRSLYHFSGIFRVFTIDRLLATKFNVQRTCLPLLPGWLHGAFRKYGTHVYVWCRWPG